MRRFQGIFAVAREQSSLLWTLHCQLPEQSPAYRAAFLLLHRQTVRLPCTLGVRMLYGVRCSRPVNPRPGGAPSHLSSEGLVSSKFRKLGGIKERGKIVRLILMNTFESTSVVFSVHYWDNLRLSKIKNCHMSNFFGNLSLSQNLLIGRRPRKGTR